VVSVVFDVGETLLDDSREVYFGRAARDGPMGRHRREPDRQGRPHHRDNDLVPAKAAGLRTAHIRRGPWGHLWADDPRVARLADWRIMSLAELPSLLASELQDVTG
jgi:hypothetical protein